MVATPISTKTRHWRPGYRIRRAQLAARRCDPLSPTIAAFFSYVALEARKYEAAVAAARDALELDGNAPITYFVLGRAYTKVGEMQAAIAALETAQRVGGWLPHIDACLGYVYARSGARSRSPKR